MITAKEIAEKYVYGRHDALTHGQEIIHMVNDIEAYAKPHQARVLKAKEALKYALLLLEDQAAKGLYPEKALAINGGKGFLPIKEALKKI